MKNLHIIIIVILAIAVIVLLVKNSRKTCFYLPTEGPDWGPKYWKAIHKIADRIPCSACHDDGVSLFQFSHDLVNIKTKKPLFFPQNFIKWKKYISQISDDGTVDENATIALSKEITKTK